MGLLACVGVERGGTGVAIFEFLLQKRAGGRISKTDSGCCFYAPHVGDEKQRFCGFFLQQIDTPPPFSRPHLRPTVMCRKDK